MNVALRDEALIHFTDLTLTLIFRCNYRCPSCLVGDKLDSREALEFDDAVRIIDSAARLRSFNSIAFVGGEPFLVHGLMLRIADYIHSRYGKVALSASTNSYWAKTPEIAIRKLEPLVKHGLHSLLLSWDDFHAQFGRIEQVANAITACNALGIEPTVQNIVLPSSTRNETIKALLGALCDTSKVDWAESPCTPVGLGAALDPARHGLVDVDDLPYGNCTAGQILNVEADGKVKPCCGSGLMAEGLTMGNVHHASIQDIVRSASADPLFNCLVAYRGPKHMVAALRQAGRDDLVPKRVTDVCDACYKITNSRETMAVLRAQLQPAALQMAMNRVIGEAQDQIAVISHYGDGTQSLFARVPGFDAAAPVLKLRADETPPRRDAPQLIEDFVARHAPALARWPEPDYLRIKAGAEQVRVAVRSKAAGSQVAMSFDSYLDRVLSPAYAVRGRDMYLSEQPIPAGLIDDFRPAERAAAREIARRASQRPPAAPPPGPDEVMLFCGRYTYTGCHEHGGYDALMMQLAGDKEVLLYAPTEQNKRALYINAKLYRNWSPVQMWTPNLTQFPDYADASPIHVRVRQGQALFIPDQWYHAVASIGDALTITATLFVPSVHNKGADGSSHSHAM